MSIKLRIIGSLHNPSFMVPYKIKKKCYILRDCLVGARKIMIFFSFIERKYMLYFLLVFKHLRKIYLFYFWCAESSMLLKLFSIVLVSGGLLSSCTALSFSSQRLLLLPSVGSRALRFQELWCLGLAA